MKMSKKEAWKTLIKYINKKEVGEIILRKELIQDLSESFRSYSTVDFYREVLCRIGTLQYVSRGQYRKLRDIPKDLSSSNAREYAFMKPQWKRWFIPFDEFIKNKKK